VRRDRRRLLEALAVLLSVDLCECAGTRGPARELVSPGKQDGFAAEYRLFWAGPDGGRKARLVAAFSPPQRLRLEILDPLGTSRALLVATETGALLVDPSRREFRAYLEGSDALRDLSGMALEPGLLASALLGDPAAGKGMECVPSEEGEPGARICRGIGGEPTVRVGRGGDEWEIRRPGAEDLHVQMKLGAGTPPAPPRWLRLRSAPGGGAAELELKDFRFGPPPEELFSLHPPPSFRDASGSPFPYRQGWTPP
jgi:hypothetical protein